MKQRHYICAGHHLRPPLHTLLTNAAFQSNICLEVNMIFRSRTTIVAGSPLHAALVTTCDMESPGSPRAGADSVHLHTTIH